MLANQELTRRSLLKGVGGGLAAAALAACGATATQAPAATSAPEAGATTAAEAATVAPSTAGGAEVTIDWWTAWPEGEGEPSDGDKLRAMIEKFNGEYPNIKVNFILGGPGGGDFNELLLARIAAGNPPDSAVLWTPPVGFAARGSLDAIDDLMATAKYGGPDKWYPRPLGTCQWRGKTYGLPFSQANYLIFYNVDVFKEKGLPTDRESFPNTWDDLRSLSASFTEWDGDELKTAGYVPFFTSWVFPVWSALNGGQWFYAADEKYAINSESNAELMNYWLAWLDEEYKGDITYLASVGNYENSPEGLWVQKRSPMADGGGWSVPYARLKPETLGFTWDVAKFPKGPSGNKQYTGFWPNWFAQPAGGKHRQEAFLLNEYMCTKAMDIWYKTVEDTPAWRDFPMDVMPQGLIDNFGEEKARDIHTFILSYLEDATEVWTSPIEDFGTDQINRAVDQIMHKATPVQQALDEAQNIAQSKLEETLKSL